MGDGDWDIAGEDPVGACMGVLFCLLMILPCCTGCFSPLSL
jgi:hypothetical protein